MIAVYVWVKPFFLMMSEFNINNINIIINYFNIIIDKINIKYYNKKCKEGLT